MQSRYTKIELGIYLDFLLHQILLNRLYQNAYKISHADLGLKLHVCSLGMQKRLIEYKWEFANVSDNIQK